MKKIIFMIIVSALFTNSAFSQALNYLSKSERNRVLQERSKEAILKYGPGYYRDVLPPLIERKIVLNGMSEFPKEEVTRNLNRLFYIVDYQYDETKETFIWGYAARTFVWEDNGKVFRVDFGNGQGFANLDKPVTRSTDPYPIMPFEPMPPVQTPANNKDEPPTERHY